MCQKMEPQSVLLQLTMSLLSGYFLLLCLTKTSSALTGLCGTDKGRTTCFACSELRDLGAAPLDCCGDPYVYSLCHACVFDPSTCDVARSKLSAQKAQDLVNANFIRQQRSPMKSKGELMQLMSFKPQRRAKYFLGKRDKVNPFLGKRTIDGLHLSENDAAIAEAFTEEAKRGANPFLGKRANPFLGKRVSDLLREAQGYVGDNTGLAVPLGNQIENKRQNPFLGKRANPFLGKRMSELLKDAEVGNTPEANMLEAKRQNPFLGKRLVQTYWPNEEFTDGETDNVFSEEDSMSKRASPFLGKRTIDTPDNIENEKTFYTRPLTRRAKYFLGKRNGGENSSQSKRQKYFLGKRDPTEEGGLMESEDFVNMHDTALTQDVSADKRPKYFLGKRDVSEVSRLADESPAELAQ